MSKRILHYNLPVWFFKVELAIQTRLTEFNPNASHLLTILISREMMSILPYNAYCGIKDVL